MFNVKIASYINIQYFDWEGLKGRLFSASYSLRPGDARFKEMIQALKVIYDKYQQNNQVEFLYTAKVYLGKISA